MEPRNGNRRRDRTKLYVTVLNKSTANRRGEYALSEKVGYFDDASALLRSQNHVFDSPFFEINSNEKYGAAESPCLLVALSVVHTTGSLFKLTGHPTALPRF